MSKVTVVLREVLGLFVDDGALALQVVAVIAVAGIAAALIPDHPVLAESVLLFGTLGTLASSVVRAIPKR